MLASHNELTRKPMTYNPVEAILILSGAAFAIGVCGAALAIGVSLGLRWCPMIIKVNTFHYKMD